MKRNRKKSGVCARVHTHVCARCVPMCLHGVCESTCVDECALCTDVYAWCLVYCVCTHVHVCACVGVYACVHVHAWLCVRVCRSVPAVTVVSRMPVQVRSTQSGVDGGQTHAAADTCSPPGPASGKAKSQRTKAPVPREHD